MNNYLITRLLLSSVGILITVTVIPLFTLIDKYFELNELFGLDDNIFAISAIILILCIFFFLLKNGDDHLSAIIFSFFYYFFIPSAFIQLAYSENSDGQLAFVVFPICIVFSILLFFILKLFELRKTD